MKYLLPYLRNLNKVSELNTIRLNELQLINSILFNVIQNYEKRINKLEHEIERLKWQKRKGFKNEFELIAFCKKILNKIKR